MSDLTPAQEKYLKRKIDIIQANIAGVGAAGYMLGSIGRNWNNAARDMAFQETARELRLMAEYFNRSH